MYNPKEHASKEFSFFFNNHIVAKPGYITKLVIQKVKIVRQKWPYKSTYPEELDGLLDYFPGNYSLTGCILTHSQIMFYKKCRVLLEDIQPCFPLKDHGIVHLNNQCLLNLIKNPKT